MVKKIIYKLFNNSNSDLNNNYYLTNYYSNLLNKYGLYEKLLKLIKYDNSKAFSTSKQINFYGSLKFGDTKQQIRNLLKKKPFFIFKNPRVKNHTVYLYKCYFGNLKATIEIHFHLNIFFMGVYSFNNNVKSEFFLNNIKNTLFDKYSIVNKEIVEDLVIVDSKDNLILLENNDTYCLKYISYNYYILNDIQNQYESFYLHYKSHEDLFKEKLKCCL